MSPSEASSLDISVKLFLHVLFLLSQGHSKDESEAFLSMKILQSTVSQLRKEEHYLPGF